MSLRCRLYDQDLLSIFRELEDLENSEKMNGDLEAGSDHYVKKYNKLMKQKKKVGFDKMKKKRVNFWNENLRRYIFAKTLVSIDP